MQKNFIGVTIQSGCDHQPLSVTLRNDYSGMEQGAGSNRRINPFREGDGFQIEAYDNDLLAKIVIFHEPDDGLSQVSSHTRISRRFHLHVNYLRAACRGRNSLNKLDNLSECRNMLKRIFFARQALLCSIKPASDVHLRKLFGGNLGDIPHGRPSPAQIRIMNHDRNTVAREVYIEFQSVGIVFESPRECSQRIFRRQR